eukprot:TRINITY_DN1354_c0_g1_i4.p1 TRINITY_DN1354_c0_g1~~TRINITY_DN1354_c0_g1_i4.p1  ORF type:complete len:405 (-),score=95.99 TRINITY_DN1354_c0_g1_i4:45-1121(-)
MGSYIKSAQDSIRTIITECKADGKRDVKFGLVTYRDHPPEDRSYVTKTFSFTSSPVLAKQYVDTMAADGGGDGPEAVADGLHDALAFFPWSLSAVKIVVFIADAPPHGLSKHQTDGLPPGWDTHDPMVDVVQMLQKEIILYSVGCEPALGQTSFARDWFKAIAEVTGGRYLSLKNAKLLPQVIIGGASEETDLEKNAALIEEEIVSIRQEASSEGKSYTEDEIFELAAKRMGEKGLKTTQGLLSDIGVGEEQTPFSGRISECKTMKEVSDMLNKESPPQSQFQFSRSSSTMSDGDCLEMDYGGLPPLAMPMSSMSMARGSSMATPTAAPAHFAEQSYSAMPQAISKEQVTRFARRKGY